MPSIRRVSPTEAQQLLSKAYLYVDVRTVQEFEALHPEGALNVPLESMGPAGAVPNPDFVPLMRSLFELDRGIVVGCATGVRSLHAARLLSEAGFTNVVDQRAGMDGARTAFGGLAEPGWVAAGLPVASGAGEGSYETVRGRAR
jgi:rhodanese-related sulfurtransferase